MSVYSPDRVNRLRTVLAIVLVLAALLAVFAAFLLVRDEGQDRSAGVIAMVVAGVLIGSGVTSVRLLADAGRPARIATVVTAVLVVLGGLGLVGTWLAFLLPLLGIGLLFLALVPDDEADDAAAR